MVDLEGLTSIWFRDGHVELPSRWQHKVWDPTESSALKVQTGELKIRAEMQLPQETEQR